MGTTTYIRIYASLGDIPLLFARIYQRLFADQAEDIEFGIYTRRTSLSSIPARAVLADLPAFVQTTIAAGQQVTTRHSGYFFPGDLAPLALACRGPQYGDFVRDVGYLLLSYDEREIFYYDEERGERRLYPQTVVWPAFPDRHIWPLDALLFRILGVYDAAMPDSAVPHLAVYVEDDRGGIEDAFVVYHQDHRAFLRDLSYSYALYQWGLGRQVLLEHSVDVWKLTESEIAAYQTHRPKSITWRSDIPDNVAHRRFIEALTLEKVQRLAEYPGDVDALLSYAIDAYPGLHSYWLGERGLLVAIDPPIQGRGSLWRWYADLLELANGS